MKLDRIIHSRQAGEFALGLSRRISPRTGKKVAALVAGILSRNTGSDLMQAICANQWVASGGTLSRAELQLRARDVLKNTGISFYNLFHYLEDPAALQEMVEFSPEIEQVIQRSREGRRGMIVAGVHLSNFDLVAQAAAFRGLKAMALSLPDPDETIQWQHSLRLRSGLEILDANLANLRQVIQRLQNGETVLTGIDRPVPEPKLKPGFFGQPAHLAVHHVQLALKAGVPVIVMGAIYGEDGRYHIHASEEIAMQHSPDRQQELIQNAELVLQAAEQIIRLAPQQWAVFQPVWPEILPPES